MLPRTHPLAGVREAFNAVFVEADAAGQLMFHGPGAGGDPTASAVLGDVVAVARHRVVGGLGPRESAYADLPVLMGRAITRYYISLDVEDRPWRARRRRDRVLAARGLDPAGPPEHRRRARGGRASARAPRPNSSS